MTIFLCSEFLKKLDPDLPFFYWTINDRYREEEADFDAEDGNPRRLANLHLNAREDAAIFVPGRHHLPARNRPTIRQQIHRFDVGLPPVPRHLLAGINVQVPDNIIV